MFLLLFYENQKIGCKILEILLIRLKAPALLQARKLEVFNYIKLSKRFNEARGD
jgi:hypothetical protein